MASFFRGQQLGRGDLNIFLTSTAGTPKNAAEISYALYDFTTGQEVLLGIPRRTAVNPSPGEYFASVLIPLDANVGRYRVRWTFREQVGWPIQSALMEFDVQDRISPLVDLTYTPNELDLIHRLRILSRDNNPDRNAHFRPPAHEETISQFNQVFGFIWEDEELREYLYRSLDDIISSPPRTPFASVDQMSQTHPEWRSMLLVGAQRYALQALRLSWISDEFTYSIGGISLDLEKSSKYEGAYQAAVEQFDKQLEKSKATVNYVKGLQQPRFGTGMRSAFGPFSILGTISIHLVSSYGQPVDVAIQDLYGRSDLHARLDRGHFRVQAVTSDGDVGLYPVTAVVRHDTSLKPLVHTVLRDGRDVVTTFDHSLLHRVEGKIVSVEAGLLRAGDKIITVEGTVQESDVASVEVLPPVQYTYDLVVPGPETFVLTNGILAHNSGKGVVSPRKFSGF